MVDKEDLKYKLEFLASMEEAGADNFSRIEIYTERYKSKYGCDDWINNFIFEYLQNRNI